MNPNVITDTSDVPSDITSLKSDEEGENSLIETIMEGSVACNVSEDIEEVSDRYKEKFYGEQQEETTETGAQPCKKINNGEDYERNEENQGNFASSGIKVVKGPHNFKGLSSNFYVNDNIMKMHTIGAVGVIAGLACISFGLYSTLEPSAKLKNVEELFQSNAREHS